MKLSELKAIADARTRREWHYTEFDTVEIGPTENAIFIAMAANYIDKLIAIAEAAKDVELEEYKENGKIEPKLSRLYYAIADLEAAP